MPDILSQDEIDALLSATGSDDGDSGASAWPGAVATNRPIITYDFKEIGLPDFGIEIVGFRFFSDRANGQKPFFLFRPFKFNF